MAVEFQRLSYDFKLDNRVPRGRIGVLMLATDYNSEQELRLMLPDGVEIFTNRVENANPLTLENLRMMERDIGRAAKGILPGLGVDLMIFACTSGTAAIGHKVIEDLVHRACPGIPVTNPILAAAAAMKSLGAAKLSVLTPYIQEVSHALIDEFSARELEVLSVRSLDMEDDIDIAMVPMEIIKQAARDSVHADAEALFISCTALRSARVAEELEQALGIPVLTSNQVMTWHALRLLGCGDAVTGFGRIFRNPMAAG